MIYEYALIWHSQYGTEEIDCFQNEPEAKRMKKEYQSMLSFHRGAGRVEIKKRRV